MTHFINRIWHKFNVRNFSGRLVDARTVRSKQYLRATSLWCWWHLWAAAHRQNWRVSHVPSVTNQHTFESFHSVIYKLPRRHWPGTYSAAAFRRANGMHWAAQKRMVSVEASFFLWMSGVMWICYDSIEFEFERKNDASQSWFLTSNGHKINKSSNQSAVILFLLSLLAKLCLKAAHSHDLCVGSLPVSWPHFRFNSTVFYCSIFMLSSWKSIDMLPSSLCSGRDIRFRFELLSNFPWYFRPSLLQSSSFTTAAIPTPQNSELACYLQSRKVSAFCFGYLWCMLWLVSATGDHWTVGPSPLMSSFQRTCSTMSLGMV